MNVQVNHKNILKGPAIATCQHGCTIMTHEKRLWYVLSNDTKTFKSITVVGHFKLM